MTSPIPLSLEDLKPQEALFELSTKPGQKLTLCRWSLRVRSWALKTYGGPEGLKQIFELQKIEEIAQMAFFMLKEKEQFPAGFDDFADSICGPIDEVAVIKALLSSIGIGEPELQKINDSMKGAPPPPNAQSPKKKIGAKSLTR